MKNLILYAAAIIILSGCASKVDMKGKKHLPFNNGFTAAEQNLLKERINGDNWGLALSGGGIRSAFFQIGVLKALYDSGKLDEIDVISSVSGGSYAAYWLYANEYFKSGYQNGFAEISLGENVFAERMCHLYRHANFVTNWKAFRTFIFGKRATRDMYEEQILRTFGRGETDDKSEFTLDMLTKRIQEKAPYLIMNGTVYNAEKKYVHARLYEMTPLHRGNDFLDYRPWKEKKQKVKNAAAISGAAWGWYLKQEVDIPEENAYGEKIEVSDGGHSENLGAIALIKRGVRNIIISDAEMDPNFGHSGLIVLIDTLEGQGYEVTESTDTSSSNLSPLVRGNESSHLKENNNEKKYGYRVFDVTKGGKTSTLYYIKMSWPTELTKTAYNEKTIKENGLNFNEYMKDEFGVKTDCTDAKTIYEGYEKLKKKQISHRDWMLAATFGYENYLNRNKNTSLKAKLAALDLIGKKVSFAKYDFPHTTTIEQSFKVDQGMAYIGLGFLQAEMLLNQENGTK